MGIRSVTRIIIRKRFSWRTVHWIPTRLASVQEPRNVIREIQMSYFLILMMMSKTQIHSCFNNIIIDMYIKITLLFGYCLNASEKAWIVFWAICHIKCFFWFPTISVSGECFAPFYASHGCCKLHICPPQGLNPTTTWFQEIEFLKISKIVSEMLTFAHMHTRN